MCFPSLPDLLPPPFVHHLGMFFSCFGHVFASRGILWLRCFLSNMNAFGAQSPSISFAHFLMYCFHFFACFSSLAHHFTSLDRGWHVNSGWHVEIKPPALRYKNRLWNYLCRRGFDTKVGSWITYAGPSSVRTAPALTTGPSFQNPPRYACLSPPPMWWVNDMGSVAEWMNVMIQWHVISGWHVIIGWVNDMRSVDEWMNVMSEWHVISGWHVIIGWVNDMWSMDEW